MAFLFACLAVSSYVAAFIGVRQRFLTPQRRQRSVSRAPFLVALALGTSLEFFMRWLDHGYQMEPFTYCILLAEAYLMGWALNFLWRDLDPMGAIRHDADQGRADLYTKRAMAVAARETLGLPYVSPWGVLWLPPIATRGVVGQTGND